MDWIGRGGRMTGKEDRRGEERKGKERARERGEESTADQRRGEECLQWDWIGWARVRCDRSTRIGADRVEQDSAGKDRVSSADLRQARSG